MTIKQKRQTSSRSIFLYCLFAFNVLVISTARAQLDTIRYEVSNFYNLSGKQYNPHWLTANRFGILDDQEYATGLLRGHVYTNYKASDNWSFQVGADALIKVPFTSSQQPDLWLQQGYASVKFKDLVLTAGLKERTLGTHATDISTGSLALSGNARPMPQILLEVPDYRPVPFTKGFVEYKGTYAHAWMGRERFLENTFLHEKSALVRVGGSLPVNLAGGLIHYVLWGGENNAIGKMPQDFRNYVNMVFGKGAENVDMDDPQMQGESVNAVGDHKGVYDLSMLAKLKTADILIYQQTPFEDGSGNNPFNGDRLLGINFQNKKKNQWVQSVVYEFMYTKYQSGPTRPGGVDDSPGSQDRYGGNYGGRDNYYNNYLYKTGWVYQDRIIGTPLFFTQDRARIYIPGFSDPDEGIFNFNIVNNRVVAHHVGIMGHFSNINYRLLSTFTSNFGTYGGINGGITEWGSIENPDLEYAFEPAKRQNYFLLEVESHPFSNAWSLLTSLAVDTGELSDNIGVLIGLKREGIFNFPRK